LFAASCTEGEQKSCEYVIGPVDGVGSDKECCAKGCMTCKNSTLVADDTTCSPNVEGDKCPDFPPSDGIVPSA
jgi:hypothetical protein